MKFTKGKNLTQNWRYNVSKSIIKKKAAAFFKEFTRSLIIAILVELAKPLMVELMALIAEWIKVIF